MIERHRRTVTTNDALVVVVAVVVVVVGVTVRHPYRDNKGDVGDDVVVTMSYPHYYRP